MPIIEFGEYTPDLPDYKNPGSTEAKNVTPSGTSYKQFLGPTVLSSDAVDDTCRGAFSTRDADGNSTTFVAVDDKLYKYDSNSHTDESNGTYNLGTDERWEFTQLGFTVVASNIADNMQQWTLGTSTDFADLDAGAPKARHIGTVRTFLVAGNTDDADGVLPHRVRWSAIGDPTDWTVSSATQSDYQDLAGEGGWVQRIIGGEYGVVFLEREIYRMTYVGSPVVFQFDAVEKHRGTPAPGSCIKVGNWIFYLADDGFYIFDGQESIPIGANRIDRTFWADVDPAYLWNIWTAVDPDDKIIYCAYPNNDATAGRPNRILMYNYAPNATRRWSYAETDMAMIFNQQAEGYTLEGLDAVSSDLDALAFSLDSRAWTNNQTVLAGYNSANKLVTFSGDPLDAVLETTEAALKEGRRCRITRTRPLVEGSNATITLQVGEKNKTNEAVSWQGVRSQLSSGDIPVRSNAFYHRFRANISGGFDHAIGVEVYDPMDAGKR